MNYGKRSAAKKKKALKSKSKKWGKKFMVTFFKVVLVLLLAVVVIGACAGFGVLKGVLDSAPDISNIDVSPSGFSTFIYDCEGNQIAKLDAEGSNRVPVTMDKIPDNLANAFVAIEDARFYDHNGIDIKGIIRAGFMGLTSGHFSEGASTITQQLLKNNVLTSWVNEKSFSEKVKRKLQEQYLAIELEKNLTAELGRDKAKEKILENYMNTINLGQNTLGVQAASKRYFGKNVYELNLSECAVIAAITQNPSRYNPITHPEKNEERREKVLDDMLDQGYISQYQHDEAMADDVYSRIQTVNEEMEETSVNSYFVDALTEDVLDDLIALGYTETQAYAMLYSGGLSIYATQDPNIQKLCDDVCSNEENFPENTKWYLDYQLSVEHANGEKDNYSKEMLKSYFQETTPGFSLLFATQDDAYAAIETFRQAMVKTGDEITGEKVSLTPQPQISMTIEDQSTGNVVAIVGGRGAKEGSRTLNRATATVRQPGSTFKVVSTYAPALDSAGLNLASVFVDAPYNYENGKPVSNWYSSGYRGNCSIRDGIRDSLNIIAVKTLTTITPQLGFDYLRNFGFTTIVEREERGDQIFSDITQSLALGGITDGVKNIELNAAYATIANGGIYIKPKLYSKILDHDGNVLIDNTVGESRQVIKDTTAYLLTDAMVDVVTSGTATSVNFGNMAIAGKTGTTSDYNDVWFSGYTPYYTCTTWAGYDKDSKLKTSAEKALAKTIWRAAMSQIHENLENKAFTVPGGIVPATVCSQSGKLPIAGLCDETLKTEYFAQGTVPTESCDVHYQGMICEYSGLPACETCPFGVPGIATMNPSSEAVLTGNTASSGTAGKCPHDEAFFAQPNAAEIIAQQRAELDAKNGTTELNAQLAALQNQLQTAQATLQVAQQQLAVAVDDVSKATAQAIIDQAAQEVNALNAQIANVQAQIAAAANAGITGTDPNAGGQPGADVPAPNVPDVNPPDAGVPPQ